MDGKVVVISIFLEIRLYVQQILMEIYLLWEVKLAELLDFELFLSGPERWIFRLTLSCNAT